MSILCIQEEEIKPFHAIFTRLILFSDEPGGAYRERKVSISSSGSILGLSRETSDNHS